MRIIAGEFKGRRIDAPKGSDTRPTLDRVKESLFGIIQFIISRRINNGINNRIVFNHGN